jgi:amidase
MGLGDELRWLDAIDQADLVRSRQVSATELVDAAIQRIEALNPALNAVILSWFEEARATAGSASGRLAGVPTLLKDLWADEAGRPITHGNAAMRAAGYRSVEDSWLVARYRKAGLVTLGRTNSPELGALPTTEPLAWGPTRNPWDLTRTPGGSSGGAAAAVASGMVPVAHASDGGGSIRIPAACCGLVGLKPSQGRITQGPRRDESGLGVEHVVTRTVRDCALVLDVTHGPGIGDAVIAPAPRGPFLHEVGVDPGRLRIGLLDHRPDSTPVHPDCAEVVRHTAGALEALGHHVEAGFPPALADPVFQRGFATRWSTNMAVGVAALSDMLGRTLTAEDVESSTWAQARWADNITAVDYARALGEALAYRRAIRAWWTEGWDLLLTPTTAEPAPLLGEHADDPTDPMAPLRRAGSWISFTPPFNTSGQPAISLPMGMTPQGLPVGIQLVAAYGREDLLLRVAAQLEAAHPWAQRIPPDPVGSATPPR